MPLIDFLITWIIRVFRGRKRETRLAEAKLWPTAHGRILEGTSRRADNPADAFSTRTAELTYFYVVRGDYFSGIALLPPESEDEVRNQIATWKERDIVVRYCPTEPSISIFLTEDQTEGIILA